MNLALLVLDVTIRTVSEIMRLLAAQEVLDLSFTEQSLFHEVFADWFLDSLLLPEQNGKLKRAYHAMVQEKLSQALSRVPLFQKACDLSFIEPSPFLSNFADAGTLVHLPYQ
jgi:hypothetical protein